MRLARGNTVLAGIILRLRWNKSEKPESGRERVRVNEKDNNYDVIGEAGWLAG